MDEPRRASPLRPASLPHAIAAIVALASWFGCTGRAPDSSASVQASLGGIRADEIARHMNTLAHDDLRGRFTGSEAYARAAAYVAENFEEFGLTPAGERGGFYQRVPLRQSTLDAERSRLVLELGGVEEILAPYVDYYLGANDLHADVAAAGGVVYAGFAVTAPELGYDDFDGIDVRGKIVVAFSGAPPSFPHDERAYYSSSRVKGENLRARGALGALWMRTPELEERHPFAKSVPNAKIPSMGWLDDAGGVQDAHQDDRLNARLSPAGAEKIFRGSPVSIDEVRAAIAAGTPESFPLPARVSARTVTSHANIECANVAAVLPGSDPVLGLEHLVLTAHLDHLGVGEPVLGDSVRNGAYDNASGVAILLELARAFVRLDAPPARSILFLAVTGEERGLLGSDYFAHHPTVPAASLVANVNLDMVMMLQPLLDVTAFGAEHSSLLEPLEAAAASVGVAVTPDPYPEEVIFVRSDQYSFVRQGVPSLFLVSGMRNRDPNVDGKQRQLDWFSNVYHTPQDDMAQAFDFEAGGDFARLNFLLAHAVADDARRPTWNEGDFFGSRFARPRAGL